VCCWSVGLVQRRIEAAGFTTISLSWIPDLTASTGAPRIAAIEHPPGLTVGTPGDHDGQMAVLRAALQALVDMSAAGSVSHLPFSWVEPVPKLDLHPPKTPPISQYLVRHPWDFPRFLRRDPPDRA
jgi:hypothetical protein